MWEGINKLRERPLFLGGKPERGGGGFFKVVQFFLGGQ